MLQTVRPRPGLRHRCRTHMQCHSSDCIRREADGHGAYMLHSPAEEWSYVEETEWPISFKLL